MAKCSKCDCPGCVYLGWHRTQRAERTQYKCCHPDKEYVERYFREHKISMMPGFLGFGYGRVERKTTPAWCPKKKGAKE